MKYIWYLGAGLIGSIIGLIASFMFVLFDGRLEIVQGETDTEIGTLLGVIAIMTIFTGGGFWIAWRNRPPDWN